MTLTANIQLPQGLDLGDHIQQAADFPMVEKDLLKGRGALIVGCGPSVTTPHVVATIQDFVSAGHVVFAIKEAVSFLLDRQIVPEFAVHIDPQAKEMDRIEVHKRVTYLLASVCHPLLYQHIRQLGAEIRVFHSACGYQHVKIYPGFAHNFGPAGAGDDGDCVIAMGPLEWTLSDGAEFSPIVTELVPEAAYYQTLFGSSAIMNGGLTVGNRAVSLAKYMGADHVLCAGLDFGWRDAGNKSGYASFARVKEHENSIICDQGRVDGQPWYTRLDLLQSAADLACHVRNGDVEIIGDSLAKSFALMPPEAVLEHVRNGPMLEGQ